MKINLKLEKSNIDYNKKFDTAIKIYDELRQDKEDFTGWVNWPINFDTALFDKMEKVAEDIRKKCEVLVVAGIGGSYLGSAAILEALGGSKAGCPEIVFAGCNLSGEYMSHVLEKVRAKETCLCVVSKSGGTMETKIAFNIIKQELKNKYGSEASSRIVAITDPNKGILREETNAEGYANFEIPGNIGGRYSAFTPAILFPLVVAGIDVRKLVEGAKDIATDEKYWKSEGVKYALTRNALNDNGKDIEVFEFYEPSMRLVGEWCKQLFGESEGKEGKGLFPATMMFSADLHSMGQYLQDGKQVFFETVINVLDLDKDVKIPSEAGAELSGKMLSDINQVAVEGVMAAHSKVGVPIIQIDLEGKDEYSMGQLMYFMMMTAGVTGKLMQVDPFTQEGVEQYKAEMRKKLS